APAVAVHDGYLYVFGGEREGYVITSASWRLSLDGGERWERLAAMPTSRARAGAWSDASGHIMVFGGEEDDPEDPDSMPLRTNVVDIYDPSTDTWTSGPSMPKRRHGRAHAALKGRLFVFGESGYMDGTEVFE